MNVWEEKMELRTVKKKSEIINTITAMKNTLEGIKADDLIPSNVLEQIHQSKYKSKQISNLEDELVKNTQSEQQNEKRILKYEDSKGTSGKTSSVLAFASQGIGVPEGEERARDGKII